MQLVDVCLLTLSHAQEQVTKKEAPDLAAGKSSASESRGLGPAMLAGRDRSYSSSCLLPPLLSLLMNPCSRPTLGGGVATCK